MLKFTYNEMLKDARKIAKLHGMTLKVDHSCYVNSKTAYKLIDRDSGLTVNNYSAMSLDCAYKTLLQNF